MWEPDEPIHSNLERILEIELPCRAEEGLGANNNQEGEFEVMCCICYSTRLEGQVPSRTCDNPQCGQSFHTYCLYEVNIILKIIQNNLFKTFYINSGFEV